MYSKKVEAEAKRAAVQCSAVQVECGEARATKGGPPKGGEGGPMRPKGRRQAARSPYVKAQRIAHSSSWAHWTARPYPLLASLSRVPILVADLVGGSHGTRPSFLISQHMRLDSTLAWAAQHRTILAWSFAPSLHPLFLCLCLARLSPDPPEASRF